jgi:plastocyanin
MRRARAWIVAVLVVALAVPVTAAAGPAEDRRGGGGPARVRMVDGQRFRPRTLRIDAGTRVRWSNATGVHHTTTSDTGLWNSHVAPGDTFARRFRTEGTFRYHCTIHASMRGTIIVS